MTARQLADLLERSALDLGPTLEPDGDWPPLVVLSRGDEILPAELGDLVNGDRERLSRAIGQAARMLGAESVGLVLCIWYVDEPATPEALEHALRTGRDLEGRRPAERPDRKEGVTVLSVDAAGPISMLAQIKRTPGAPPELEPFITAEPGTVHGRMFDPLIAAMQAQAN